MLWKSRAVATWTAPLLIALESLIIGAVYPRTIFNAIGESDSFMFLGAGLDYDQSGYANIGYKVSRVPWLLVEYWFRHALSPIVAQYAIQFFVHILLGLAVYFALRSLLGMGPAFIGATFLIACTELYHATWPDYSIAFSAALYAVTFLLVTVASRRPFSYRLYALCGAALALTVHTNLIFLFFTPILLAQAIRLRRRAELSLRLWRIVYSATGGALAATLLLGLLAVAYGHPFNFVWPQIQFMIDSTREANAKWYEPWSTGWWYNAAYFGCYLGIGVVSALAGLFLLRSGRRNEPYTSSQIGLLFQYVYIFLLFAIAQATGHEALQPLHVPFELLVPLAMALAALIACVPSGESYRPGPFELAVMWLSIVVPLCWNPLFNLLRSPVPEGQAPFVVSTISISIFAVAILASCIIRVNRPGVWFLIMSLLLGIGNVEVAAEQPLFHLTTCNYYRDGYLAINDLNNTLISSKPRPTDVFIWQDPNETMQLQGCDPVNIGDLAYSFRSTGVGYILNPERQSPDWLKYLALTAPVPYILVASNEPAAATTLLQKFARLHYTMRAEPVHVHEGDLTLNFVAIRRP